MIYYFGYAKTADNPDNPTGFFDFSESDLVPLSAPNEWIQSNESMIEWASQLSDDELDSLLRPMTVPENVVSIIDEKVLQKMPLPVIHNA